MKIRSIETRILTINLCVLLAVAGACSRAQAQTASQVTDRSYAPPVLRAVNGGWILPAASGQDIPEGADTLHVTPSGVEVENSRPELEAAVDEIETRLAGHRVNGVELFQAARDLEKAYVRAGFILSRVSLPPQTIRDGEPLKLVVTDGYIEQVDVSALPRKIQARVAAIVAPLNGRRGLTRRELERQLLLASDLPGVALRSTLKAGSEPGGTIVVVNGAYQPVTGGIAANSAMSDAMGGMTTSFGANLNSILGLGESVFLRLDGYPGFGSDGIFSHDPRNRQIAAGVRVPLNSDGLWAGLEAVDSQTHPSSELGYSMVDAYQRLTARLGYDWVRSRDVNLVSSLSFDVSNELQQIDLAGERTDFSKDRMRVIRANTSANYYTPWNGILSGNITASFGLKGLGAREPTTLLPVSRDGSGPSFEKLDIALRYDQPAWQGRLRWSAVMQAQTSFGAAMAASEQMGLGGGTLLSAFETGDLLADNGVAIRGEMALPRLFQPISDRLHLAGTLTPYVFSAAGIAQLENPTNVETSVTRAMSLGAGLRLALPQEQRIGSGILTLEYAHGSASQMEDKDRLNVSFSLGF